MKRMKKLPLFLSLILVLQLLFPIVGVFAAELQAPTNLTGNERYPGNVMLEWDAVPNSTAYKVYKLDGETKTLATQVSTNKATVNLTEGMFTFAVTAIVSGKESQLSSPYTIEIIYPEMQPPSNVKASIERFYDLTLSWNAAEYVTYYKIYKVIDGKRELVVTTPNTSFKLTSLSEGNYHYEVTSYSSRFGESVLGSSIEADIVYPDMQPPSNVTYSISSGSDLTLKWQSALYANKYNIYKLVNGKRELVGSSNSQSYMFSKLPEGNYVYEITSYSYAYGESKESSQVEASIIYPNMNAPTNVNLSFTNGNDGTLIWDKVEYAETYKVYQVIDGQKVLLLQTPYQQSSFKNMLEGNYIYEVSAYNSRFGESQAARIEHNLVYPNMQPPEGVTGYVLNIDGIYLKWDFAEFATSYNIYQIDNGERKLVANTINKFMSFANLPKGNYKYEITSVSERFGESAPTSQVELEISYPIIEEPQNVGVSVNQDNNTIALWWDEVEYASSYHIYQVINGEYTLIETTPNTRIQFRNLQDGRYIYVVQATSKYGDSPYSAEVSAVIEPDLEAPKAPVATIEGDDAELSWEPVPGADSYNVYEEVDGELVLIGTTPDPNFTIEDVEPGNHEYQIVPVSPSGQEGSSSSTVIIDTNDFDTIAPVTESNVTGLWFNSFYQVELTATDDKSGVAKTYYSTDGLTYVEGTSFMVDKEDITTVFFYSVDNAGNVEEAKQVEVKLDFVAPITSSNVTDEWLKEGITVELTATDNQSGVGKTYYSVNGLDYIEGTSFEVSEEGINEVSFYSVDNAGNVEEIKTGEVKIDEKAPETVSNVTESFTVELTATDDLSGVAKTFYSVNGSDFVEGTSFEVSEAGVNEVSFYSVDNAGNVEETKTVEVKIDENAPETVSNVTEDWLTESFTVELTATDDLSGVAKTYYSVNGSEFVEGTSFEVSEAGINEVTFYSVDNAGNKEEAQTVEVIIDKTAPETVSNVTEGWMTELFTVELTATDDLSGVAKTYYSVNGSEFVEGTSFEVSEAGENEVSFYSVDNAGNKEEAKTVTVKVDVTAPETVSNVTEDWLTESFTVELTATDGLSGVAKTYYSVNGSDFVEGTSFEVSEAGINEVSFYSVDNAGNVEETKTVEVKIDENAPETVSNVTEDWLTESFTVELTATDDLSGVAKTYYSVNGSEFVEGTSFEVSEVGINEVSFYSIDNAGNKEEAKTVAIKVDVTAPETVSNVTEVSTIELTATDDLSGVAKTFYSVNGSDFVEGTSFEVSEAGINEVTFYSIDNAGNKEEAKKVTVKADVTAPETVSNVTEGWVTEGFTVELTATDDLSGVAKTYYSVNGSDFVEGTSFEVSEEGIHKVTFYSVDNAGNVENAKTADVKLDKTAPIVSWSIEENPTENSSTQGCVPNGLLSWLFCFVHKIFGIDHDHNFGNGSEPTSSNPVLVGNEFNNEYKLGTKLQVSYNAIDAVSGIAIEELTVNGQLVENGEIITLNQTGEYNVRVTVVDHAGLKTTLEKSFNVYIEGDLEITPGTIKTNKGEFTARVTLPSGIKTNFELSSVTLNGVKAIDKGKGSEQQAAKGQFKFNREDFNWNKGDVQVELRGKVNGKLVVASTTVKVK